MSLLLHLIKVAYYRVGAISFIAFGGIVSLLGSLPTFILHPAHLCSIQSIRDVLFAGGFALVSPLIDKTLRKHKEPLFNMAHGVVLELGPGTGPNIKYYNADKVNKLILVEPNVHLHAALLKNAALAGFPASKVVLCPCGAEDAAALERLAGVKPRSIDTVVSCLTLCMIPNPKKIVDSCYEYLKPGGQLLFLEHIKSHDAGTASFQDHLNGTWKCVFNGCEINRATDKWIAAHEWETIDLSMLPEESMLQKDPKVKGFARKPK